MTKSDWGKVVKIVRTSMGLVIDVKVEKETVAEVKRLWIDREKTDEMDGERQTRHLRAEGIEEEEKLLILSVYEWKSQFKLS